MHRIIVLQYIKLFHRSFYWKSNILQSVLKVYFLKELYLLWRNIVHERQRLKNLLNLAVFWIISSRKVPEHLSGTLQ